MTLDSEPAEVHTHRLALALVRLGELGDQDAAWELVDGLSVDELRAVLLTQTANVLQAFPPWFEEAGLAAAVSVRGLTAADYLGTRILRMANEEFGGGDE
jgi:hypothetical protein